MVRKCLGLSGGPACRFAQGGKPAQPKPGQSRCSWCDPELLHNACSKAGDRARLKQLLRNMPRESQQAAMRRLPQEVYVDNFEAEFGTRDIADNLSMPADARNPKIQTAAIPRTRTTPTSALSLKRAAWNAISVSSSMR